MAASGRSSAWTRASGRASRSSPAGPSPWPRYGVVLAAVNIAHIEGEPVDSRDVEPTAGEIRVVKTRSREVSPENRELPDDLARRVALGELDVEAALAEHREGTASGGTDDADGDGD